LAGTFGFIAASVLTGLGLGTYFRHWGWIPFVSQQDLLVRVGVASLVAALVETLPVNDWDNITVFLSALAADRFVAQKQSFLIP